MIDTPKKADQATDDDNVSSNPNAVGPVMKQVYNEESGRFERAGPCFGQDSPNYEATSY